jgi:molybdopterin-binding protein
LTRVRLEDGTELVSTDEVYGPVGVVVYPWDVSLSRSPIAGSALNQVVGEISSIVPLGNRARVRVGSFVTEVTAFSLRQLELEPGDRAHASFKATATRLLPLG